MRNTSGQVNNYLIINDVVRYKIMKKYALKRTNKLCTVLGEWHYRFTASLFV